MAHFLLAPSGSHGDVHPYLALGRALQARGHRVGLNASAHFERLAAGFEFDAVGTEEDFQETIHDPGLWHPTKSLHVLFGGEKFKRLLTQSYRLLEARCEPETVIVGGSLSVAARIAHDKLGVPMATVHLQPMAYPSISDPPAFPGFGPKPWWPHWLTRGLFWYGERRIIDPILAPAVNGLRAELGLPPIERIWGAWRHSPRCVLGFFPEWYGRARDWPPRMHCTGFVRYDQGEAGLPAELEAFLTAGEPPVVVSFGSAMRQGGQYFEAAVAACRRLGKRVVILARSGPQIPTLTANELQVDYAPFSFVFPKAAAVIHHGGIGTIAQALAAGVPQLVMPLAFDQFDNAVRIEKLGVAKSLPCRKFTAKRAEQALRELFAIPDLAANCERARLKMRHDPLPEIVAHLEGLASHSGPA